MANLCNAPMLSPFVAQDLPGLILSVDSSNFGSITKAYQNITATGSGTSGTKLITASADQTGLIQPGYKVRIGGTDIYTDSIVATTALTTVETLSATYTAGSALALDKGSVWGDLSGQTNNLTQSTNASKCVYNPNQANGNAVFGFDGLATGWIVPTAIRNAITRTTAHTMFFVFRAFDLGAVTPRTLLNAAQGGAGSDMLSIDIINSVLSVGYYNGSSYNAKSIAFTDIVSFHVLGVSHAANAAPLCILDSVTMSGSSTPQGDTSDGAMLGTQIQASAKWFWGDMARWDVYNSAFSLAQMTEEMASLKSKYGTV